MSTPFPAARRGAARAILSTLWLAGTALLAACGAAGTPASPAATTPAAAGPVVLPTVAPAPAGALVFAITPEQSKATFRVREQLVGVQVPSDAVGTTGAVSGQIVLRREGGVAAESSRISVDLRELRSDDPRRDSFIKQNTLRTGEFPTAEFIPRTAPGLPSPVPASGEHTFRLSGGMVIRGVQRDVTWDVTARLQGAQLTGRATTTVKFGDFGMTPPRADPVLMVLDEIRLELDLVGTQA